MGDQEADIARLMASLGLPTSFVSGERVRRERERGPSSLSDDEKSFKKEKKKKTKGDEGDDGRSGAGDAAKFGREEEEDDDDEPAPELAMRATEEAVAAEAAAAAQGADSPDGAAGRKPEWQVDDGLVAYLQKYSKWEKKVVEMLGKGVPRSYKGADGPVAIEKLNRFWRHRREIFEAFDWRGPRPMLDSNAWYSITPEHVARELANYCAERIPPPAVVLDPFCGPGGNAIQFALRGYYVVAIDIDPVRLEQAVVNSRLYGVRQFIEFINGDFMELAPRLKADMVYLSPPWGGLRHDGTGKKKNEPFLLSDIPVCGGGLPIIETARRISPAVTVFLPKRTALEADTFGGAPYTTEYPITAGNHNLGIHVSFGDLRRT